MPSTVQVPLEDELGDILEKAMTCAGLNPETLAEKARVPVAAIHDAIDYRPELTPDECRRLASALGLNEVGLCALALNKYPLPNLEDLPFRLWPLRMPHGIGVVNAYVVACRDEERGLLFDTGPGPGAPETGWPAEILGIDAVFITHIEAEHAGGLQGAISHFGLKAAYIPAGSKSPLGIPLGEAEKIAVCGLEVTAFRTPGHCALHNCYHVSLAGSPSARSLLISGDLVFAGSAGGPFYCKRQLREHLGRVLATVPGDTAVAPGHGPMTTAANELRYNPFVF